MAELNHTIVITRFRNLAADQCLPQAAQLVAIQIADEVVHDPGRRRRRGADAMQEELLEHLRSIAEGHHRGC